MPGQQKSDTETPSLCLDLCRFDANLTNVSRIVRSSGKNWRPRAACHKSPEIASRQLAAGAIGITCAKVSEAEVFASAGIRDILIADLPAGIRQIRRIAALCRGVDLVVACDHYVQAATLSAECTRQGVTCRTLVNINIGMNQTGVRPGHDAFQLARGIERLPGLKLAGIMGCEGHLLSMTSVDEKRKSIDAALGILAHTQDAFTRNGICCDIVSAGGTGSFRQSLLCEVLTEVQAGGAIFGDPFHSTMPDSEGFQPALTVLSTIVSRPAFDRAVIDAGRHAITADFHPPVVKDWPDAKIVMHTAEYIVFELGPVSRELRIGDQIELIVADSEFTTMLHDQIHCFREDRLEAIWPLVARGKLV